jgi:hypothetical protein
MLETTVVLLVGFACGYGVREIISRRRHAAARKKASEKKLTRDNLDAIYGLTQAKKLQQRAADHLHDWPDDAEAKVARGGVR